jgi:predicted thioesterase
LIRFNVAAFHGDVKIGEGRHGRGLVNVAHFKKRFGVP